MRNWVCGWLGNIAMVAAAVCLFGPGMAAEQARSTQGSQVASNPPSKWTEAINNRVRDQLDFTDTREFEFANRGRLAAPDSLVIKNDEGKVIWSQDAYAFLEDDPPGSANPSLWRNARLNHIYGLFEVTVGVYQVRGYDMSNITFIACTLNNEKNDDKPCCDFDLPASNPATGEAWIVFDPLMSVECTRAAKALVDGYFGERPIAAVLMSHPHVDHYGGIKGLFKDNAEAEAKAKEIPIIAPAGFNEHAVSENVYAGNAMGRRAGYQYGVIIPTGPDGALSIGIGMGQSKGTISYLKPNVEVTETGQRCTIGGVTMEFQLTPGTEAPVEMNIWFPDKRALWLAENCTATMHNLYTLRGTQVRDGNAWAEYIMEALTRYGDRADVVFQAHNWPHWGAEVIKPYMLNTAAVYKFLNDQTLMYINQGYTQNEIARMITLPEALEKFWYIRPYYGTVSHNSKAVYQRFMGWYDANPAHLNALSPSERASNLLRYLDYDVDKVLRKAREDYEAGNYQWVAEATNLIVFADPADFKVSADQLTQAKLLCADALEQMGYQAESGTWRNVYLSGAKELRDGTTRDPALRATGSKDTQMAMTPAMLFDYMGIALDSNAAQAENFRINFVLTDDDLAGDNRYLVTVNSGVLLYQSGVQATDTDATVTTRKDALLAMFTKGDKADEILRKIPVEGDADILFKLKDHMVQYQFFFDIVTP